MPLRCSPARGTAGSIDSVGTGGRTMRWRSPTMAGDCPALASLLGLELNFGAGAAGTFATSPWQGPSPRVASRTAVLTGARRAQRVRCRSELSSFHRVLLVGVLLHRVIHAGCSVPIAQLGAGLGLDRRLGAGGDVAGIVATRRTTYGETGVLLVSDGERPVRSSFTSGYIGWPYLAHVTLSVRRCVEHFSAGPRVARNAARLSDSTVVGIVRLLRYAGYAVRLNRRAKGLYRMHLVSMCAHRGVKP